MKRLFCLLPLLVAVSSHVSATEMTGFATEYYDEDGSLTEISTTVPLSPTIAIGKQADEWRLLTCQISPAHQLTKTAQHAGSAFMTTMARILVHF